MRSLSSNLELSSNFVDSVNDCPCQTIVIDYCCSVVVDGDGVDKIIGGIFNDFAGRVGPLII